MSRTALEFLYGPQEALQQLLANHSLHWQSDTFQLNYNSHSLSWKSRFMDVHLYDLTIDTLMLITLRPRRSPDLLHL